MPSGRCCCVVAPRAASPSSATARRPATASPSRGPSGWHASASRTSTVAPLTVNYRTPAEVMAEAEPVIRAALPEANVPTSVRESGIPVLHAPVAERDAIIEDWLAEHAEGTAVVIERPLP